MKSKCCNAELKEVRKHDGVYGPGRRYWTEHYYCSKCGLMYHETPTKRDPKQTTLDDFKLEVK